jgi:hypothetical protein
MGSLRFRRSVKIAPGVRFNFNKRSVGVSVGTRGARYSVNSDGRRTRSVGVPGTGLSYRDQQGPTTGSPRKQGVVEPWMLSPTLWLAHGIAIITAALVVFGFLNHHPHFAGVTLGIGFIAYIVLRLLRPILDPLVGLLLARRG